MSAQEFSSPGAHMASSGGSSSSSSVSVAWRNPNNPYNSQANSYAERDILYAPNASSASRVNRDYDDVSYNFNKRYMNYNDNLFNTALEYDKYMSNTAIQRQVEDLKAAGLNPILATRLGGAVYHGATVPYATVAPASALGAYTGYDSSIYSTDKNVDIAKLSNDNKLEVAKEYVNGQLEAAGINVSSALKVAQVNADVQYAYHEVLRVINEDNIHSQQEINKSNRIASTIGTVIGSALGAAGAVGASAIRAGLIG